MEREADEIVTWERTFKIAKVKTPEQLVFGWSNEAVDKDGAIIVDHQGDFILPEDLEKAAYDHVLYSRNLGEQHERVGVGRLVESVVFTKEKQKAMGIPLGLIPECAWWVGYHVDDDDVWKRVESGEYDAWSIGGSGRRIPNG